MKFFIFVYIFLLPIKSFSKPCKMLYQMKQAHVLQCNGIKVLKLKGTPEEKGEAYGKMIQKKYLSNQLMYAFSSHIEEGLKRIPIFGHFIGNTLTSQFEKSYHKHAPLMTRELLSSYTHVNKFKKSSLFRALLAPDLGAIGPVLQSYSMTFLDKFLTLTLGCSSASYNEDNKAFVHGRNLDYTGYQIYDKEPLMVIRYPEPNTNKLIRVGFTTESFPFSSITGLNEKGITFSIHQIYSDIKTIYGGVPILSLGEKVLSQAHTLKEAIDLINQNKTGPLWNIILSDLNQGKVVSIMVSKKHFHVRHFEKGIFGATNHLLPEHPLKKHSLLNYGIFKESSNRLKQIQSLLNSKEAKSNFSFLSKILKYQKNEFMTPYEDVIGSHTIQTVIWEKTNNSKKVYLSSGLAPASSGNFVEFEFNNLFDTFSSPLKSKQKVSSTDKKKRKNAVISVDLTTKALDIFQNKKMPYPEGSDQVKKFFKNNHVESPSFFLLKGISLHHTQDYKESNQALNIPATYLKKIPNYVQEMFNIFKVFNLFYLNEDKKSIELANKMIKTGVCDPYLQKILNKFLKYPNKNNHYLKKVQYKPSWGGLTTPFYREEKLVNRRCKALHSIR